MARHGMALLLIKAANGSPTAKELRGKHGMDNWQEAQVLVNIWLKPVTQG